jgi:ethanolamine ammonia-lyase small subunit
MSEVETTLVDSWQVLRQLTEARIALGRAGSSLPTKPQLDFQLAHARARDAVHHPLDVGSVRAALENLGLDVKVLQSAAGDRRTFLLRPDLGRRLSEESRLALEAYAAKAARPVDLAIVVADGLSALAIERNAARFLQKLLPKLEHQAITLSPVCLVQQARVALGDDISEVLGAKMVAILIGERPGLSSPDSMGIYMTWQPKVGIQDSARNCLSNIRAQGMSDDVAVEKFIYLLTQAMQRKLTGVALKDETVLDPVRGVTQTRRFIL